jgi:hypothetical protein
MSLGLERTHPFLERSDPKRGGSFPKLGPIAGQDPRLGAKFENVAFRGP